MGTDINGWVEVKRIYPGANPPYDVQWEGIIKIDGLVERNYDMFSCLFGITPYASFLPIAYNRGLPLDISEAASAGYLAGEEILEILGETWVAWSEIAVMNWKEDALDSRPHKYERNATGELVYVSKAASRSANIPAEGRTWQVGAITYRVERITRREALSPGWAVLLRLMQTLAEEYEGDNVRLVVWFDR